MSPTIDDLPVEILRHILELLREDDWDPKQFMVREVAKHKINLHCWDYMNASLVCERWRPEAQAILWSRIRLTSRTQAYKIVKSGCVGRHQTTWLKIDGDLYDEQGGIAASQLVSQVLDALRRVKYLAVYDMWGHMEQILVHPSLSSASPVQRDA